jgi:hypothetical protein
LLHAASFVAPSAQYASSLARHPGPSFYAGVSWPNPRGALAEAILAAGRVGILQFETMSDALACHGRLMHQAAQASA